MLPPCLPSANGFSSHRRASPPRPKSPFPAPAKRAYARDSATPPRAAPTKCKRLFISSPCAPAATKKPLSRTGEACLCTRFRNPAAGRARQVQTVFHLIALRPRRDRKAPFPHGRSVLMHATPRPRRGPRPPSANGFSSHRRASPPRPKSPFPAPAKRAYARDSATSPRAAAATAAK